MTYLIKAFCRAYRICTVCIADNVEFSVGALDVEEDLGAFRTADPVALDLLQRVAPLEPLQSVDVDKLEEKSAFT